MPEGVWVRCEHCASPLFAQSFEKNLQVCHKCGHHHRVGAQIRLQQLAQGADFKLIGESVKPKDYLQFKDKKPYTKRLQEARTKSGLSESLLATHTSIQGQQVVLAIFSFDFIGGSMGYVLGERFVQAVEYAIKNNLPFMCVTASGGARMQEGVVALFQMAKTSMALARYKQTKMPYISVLTDPTSGGVAASMAMQADIIIAEKGALIGFTGPRVIAQTLREDLPEGFQRAEFLLRHGAIDAVVERQHLPDTLSRILSKLTRNIRVQQKEAAHA